MSQYQPSHHQDSRTMQERAPCDSCRYASRCKAEQLACRAFSMFMAGVSPLRWAGVHRSPTREQYDTLLSAG
jgi:hypothetical protein